MTQIPSAILPSPPYLSLPVVSNQSQASLTISSPRRPISPAFDTERGYPAPESASTKTTPDQINSPDGADTVNTETNLTGNIDRGASADQDNLAERFNKNKCHLMAADRKSSLYSTTVNHNDHRLNAPCSDIVCQLRGSIMDDYTGSSRLQGHVDSVNIGSHRSRTATKNNDGKNSSCLASKQAQSHRMAPTNLCQTNLELVRSLRQSDQAHLSEIQLQDEENPTTAINHSGTTADTEGKILRAQELEGSALDSFRERNKNLMADQDSETCESGKNFFDTTTAAVGGVGGGFERSQGVKNANEAPGDSSLWKNHTECRSFGICSTNEYSIITRLSNSNQDHDRDDNGGSAEATAVAGVDLGGEMMSEAHYDASEFSARGYQSHPTENYITEDIKRPVGGSITATSTDSCKSNVTVGVNALHGNPTGAVTTTEDGMATTAMTNHQDLQHLQRELHGVHRQHVEISPKQGKTTVGLLEQLPVSVVMDCLCPAVVPPSMSTPSASSSSSMKMLGQSHVRHDNAASYHNVTSNHPFGLTTAITNRPMVPSTAVPAAGPPSTAGVTFVSSCSKRRCPESSHRGDSNNSGTIYYQHQSHYSHSSNQLSSVINEDLQWPSRRPSPSIMASPDDDPHIKNPSNPFISPFYRVVTDGCRRTSHVSMPQPARLLEGTPGRSIYHPVCRHRTSMGEVSIYTDIGGRKTQEDRFICCPTLADREDCLMLGVFDGTVGDFASDTVAHLVAPHLVNAPSWKKVSMLLDDQGYPSRRAAPFESAKASQIWSARVFPFLADAMDEMCLRADSELVDRCAHAQKHYASSTAVAVVVARHCCAVAHLGDSRAMLGHFGGNDMFANFLTDDHKPNQFYERTRIRKSGGSVEYLHNHNNKPFIRGGDFTLRKARGEQPMQLQYSRAFGGKDLKTYGLSNEPDILSFKIEPFHCCLIIASDGLWDVLTATDALTIAVNARLQDEDPAKALVQVVLNEQMALKQTADNITAIAFFFNTPENQKLFKSMKLNDLPSNSTSFPSNASIGVSSTEEGSNGRNGDGPSQPCLLSASSSSSSIGPSADTSIPNSFGVAPTPCSPSSIMAGSASSSTLLTPPFHTSELTPHVSFTGRTTMKATQPGDSNPVCHVPQVLSSVGHDPLQSNLPACSETSKHRPVILADQDQP